MKQRKKCRKCGWALVRDDRKMEQWLENVLGAQFRYQWEKQNEMGWRGDTPPVAYGDSPLREGAKGCGGGRRVEIATGASALAMTVDLRGCDRRDRERIWVVHPEEYRRWLEQGPCVGCPCERRCDEICLLRARWWDARMERLRRGL